jgi:hypothetical protein
VGARFHAGARVPLEQADRSSGRGEFGRDRETDDPGPDDRYVDIVCAHPDN